MLLEPGERTQTVADQQAHIEQVLSQKQAALFVAEEDGQLVGYLEASGGMFKRSSHSVYIVVGILAAYTRRGIGTQLFMALEAWAQRTHIHRLELTVMTTNTAAVALYRKRGFVIEGTRKDALLVNGHFIDEYYMAKLLR